MNMFDEEIKLLDGAKAIGTAPDFSWDITVPTDKRAHGTTGSWFRFIAGKR
jgi:hypothetical protein